MAFNNHYYDEQIKKYIIQFMMIFGNMKVKIGKNEREPTSHLISVPIFFGNKDRVVAHILNDNTQNKLLRLPAMSCVIQNIEMAPEMRKGIGNVRRQTFAPVGGVVPDDVKVVKQQMPIPYSMTVELAIWTSNMDERYQILEQILMLFDPIVQIQKNDALFDWTKLSMIELLSVNYEDNYPIGTDTRIIVSNLTFKFPIWISAPANVKDDFVQDIYARIGAVDFDSMSSEEIIADLDQQGVHYNLIASLDSINIPEFGTGSPQT